MTSISQLGMGNTRKTKQKTGGLQLGNGLQLYKFLSCFSWPGWPFSIVLVDVPSLWHQTRPARLGHRRKDTRRHLTGPRHGEFCRLVSYLWEFAIGGRPDRVASRLPPHPKVIKQYIGLSEVTLRINILSPNLKRNNEVL